MEGPRSLKRQSSPRRSGQRSKRSKPKVTTLGEVVERLASVENAVAYLLKTVHEIQSVTKTTIVLMAALKDKGILNDDDLNQAYESLSKQGDGKQGSDPKDSDSDTVNKDTERSEVQSKDSGTNEGSSGPLRSPLL